MKYIKMLGLLAVAAAALMAFAGVASATTITSSTGETPTIIAKAGHGELHNLSLNTSTTCTESEVEAHVTSHGAGIPASGPVTKLTFSNCGESHITVLKKGTLSVTAAGEGNGTVTSTGAEITILNTKVGVSCIYSTNNTHIGTLSGGVLKIESAAIPRTGHSFFCGT